MTPTTAKNSMKMRLDIPASDTTFDSIISSCLSDAVDRLAPTVFREVDALLVPVTPSHGGEAIVDLSQLDVALDDIRELEAVDSFTRWPVDTYRMHGTELKVRDIGSATSLKIYGLQAYTLVTLPPFLKPAVFYYAQSIFYTFLLSNKAKYNVYMQNGGRAVDEMANLVDFWETKGDDFLKDKGYPLGR